MRLVYAIMHVTSPMSFALRWVPIRHFMVKVMFFPPKLVRILSHVTKIPPKYMCQQAYSIRESTEDVFPFLSMSISTTSSIFFFKKCVKIT